MDLFQSCGDKLLRLAAGRPVTDSNHRHLVPFKQVDQFLRSRTALGLWGWLVRVNNRLIEKLPVFVHHG